MHLVLAGRRRTAIAVIAVLLPWLMAAGCATAPAVGAAAPDFEGVDQRGEPVSLAMYRGRVLILDFWSLWCAPCLRSGPLIEQLHRRYEHDPSVSLLAVHIVDDGEPAAYLAEHGYTYRTIERGTAMAADYDINALPTYLVVSAEGSVAWRHFGMLTDAVRDELVEVVERLRP